MSGFRRKVIRNRLKQRQGNNKIKKMFHYIKELEKLGDYKNINKILG